MAMLRPPEFIQSFFSKAGNGIGGFFRLAGDKTAGLRGSLKEKLDGLPGRFPADRRIILTAAIGVPVILLLVIVGASLVTKETSVKPAPASGVTTRRIPAEDLFLPDEPDFVPGVLLEREKRAQWTADDAMPWWQDPLKDGEQEWRDQIEKTVDEIMENVP
ncbi:MAG: hypothetical protein LBU85_13105 [Treponema sp.]|jgi:hypothetical protein|nr:hypothetical protein [Treponema sp.]